MKLPLSFFALLLSSLSSFAQPKTGTLDSTFGANGIVIDSFGKGSSTLAKTLVLGDGKFMAVGDSSGGFVHEIVLKRYQVNGKTDTTFGFKGSVYYALDTDMYAKDAVLQPDGKILVTGFERPFIPFKLLSMRIMPDGSLDSSFGINGRTVIISSFPGLSFYGQKIALQDDGKILIGGTAITITNETQFLIARLNLNGTIDSTFNSNGLLVVDKFSPTENNLYDFLYLQSGKSALIGYYTMPTQRQVVIMRINKNGSIDSTFGDNGIAYPPDFGSTNNYAYSLAEQQDRKLIAGVNMTDTGAGKNISDDFLLRFNENGTPDTTWGYKGRSITHLYPAVLKINADSQILLGGYKLLTDTPTQSYAYAVARFTINGAFDSTFGINGITTVAVNNIYSTPKDFTTTLAIDTFSRSIILGGFSNNQQNVNYLKFRLRIPSHTNVTTSQYIRNLTFYPNPTNSIGQLRFYLDQPSSFFIFLNDITGRIVKIISSSRNLPSGSNELNINMSNLLPGNYYLNIFNEGETKTIKIIKN